MTKTLADAKLVRCNPLPRYVRRIIHDTERCHYQREEYLSSAQRNSRYSALHGVTGLVRYSDMNSTGLMVYVVAWPIQSNDNGMNRNGQGMAAANREATGGRVPLPPAKKSQENDNDNNSIQLDDAGHGKSEKLEIESDSI
jgi:hypothetical protein